jgi:hypothetical protein
MNIKIDGVFQKLICTFAESSINNLYIMVLLYHYIINFYLKNFKLCLQNNNVISFKQPAMYHLLELT